MKQGSNILLIIALVAVAIFLARAATPREVPPYPPIISVGGVPVHIEYATSAAAIAQGLGGRASLRDGSGMLFVFEKPGAYPFWMKDVRFPIDIIWIDETFHVADVTSDISSETYPRTFSPRVPVRYVLETNAGFAKQNGIAAGDAVLFGVE